MTHPGSFVREHVLPRGVSVKDAAQRLGIGRPALSNFLNGKAGLSPEMAVRLEKAFGADRKKLLELQASFDRQSLCAGEKHVAVRPFVPSFLTIKARQIEDWAVHNLEARSHLAVLLRKLVHSTTPELLKVDLPGYDDSQRTGPDGVVEADSATPWVPEGRSYWEFGTDKDPGAKARKDYAARLKSVDPDERARSTFVFVTPRRWNGKAAFEKEKTAAGHWKAARAFDSSDLEQWLEQSVPAQTWLAEQLGLPAAGFETLEQAWRRWADAAEPSLTPELFAPSIAAYVGAIKKWLDIPPERPFIVAADSRAEALAFLARLFETEELQRHKDLAAVFASAAPLRTLVASSVPFIPIVHTEDVERELGDAHRRLHCIVVRPRNAVDTNVDVALDLLGHEAFEKALVAMGIDQGEFDRLARESGRSPTILRRRLSPNAAIKTPAWASDESTKAALLPIALVGAWHVETEADREILSYVGARTHGTIESAISRLLQHDDSPVWSAGSYRGVASKVDALFAIASIVTGEDLDRFFFAAECVLSESDPALDLPDEKRWAAALYGKKRDHSAALREGICETLVILAVHGNNLLQNRLGVDVEGRVTALIRNLVTPLTSERLLSHEHDLPRYAEAAPDAFLTIFEEDLRRSDPVVLSLLKPVDSGMFGASPSRAGLLWALECLAWAPRNLTRVCAILSQLSRQKINDNWANKPEASLKAIFRSWMPQTSASLEQRTKALETLINRFPEVAWDVCIEEFKPGPRIGHYSYRPRWRSDASGAGQVVVGEERLAFVRKVLDLLIAWPTHDENTLGDLVESLQGMPAEDQAKVWDLIDTWSSRASETAAAALRERIRRFAFTRLSRRRKLEAATRDRARAAYERLRPRDPVVLHAWLFTEQWVHESADELEDDDFDHQKRAERIDTLRREAMAEIWAAKAFEGVTELLARSGAAVSVGQYAASCVTGLEAQAAFVRSCLSVGGGDRSKAEWCLQGFLSAIEAVSRSDVLRAVAGSLLPEDRTRLFVCGPFEATTWRLLDAQDEDIRTAYWARVFPSWGRHTPAELSELIDRLLDAKRPRAAFHAVQLDFDEVETLRLKRLLHDVATVNAEPMGQLMLERYHISSALKSLQGRAGVTRDEMAHLEFLFIDALDDSEYGIPNLERQIAESPAVFAQAVALAYKRSEAGEDPPEWRIENPEQREAAAMAAHRLLDQAKRIPGSDDSGKLDTAALITWLIEVRRLCEELGRTWVGDYCLGQLLANAPEGTGGVWPCEAVCEAIEGVATAAIKRGFYIRVYNSRGPQWRGEGGEQERQLAAKYRTKAERVRFDFPFVGGVLDVIAESYEREARWHDSEAKVAKRLRH